MQNKLIIRSDDLSLEWVKVIGTDGQEFKSPWTGWYSEDSPGKNKLTSIGNYVTSINILPIKSNKGMTKNVE